MYFGFVLQSVSENKQQQAFSSLRNSAGGAARADLL